MLEVRRSFSKFVVHAILPCVAWAQFIAGCLFALLAFEMLRRGMYGPPAILLFVVAVLLFAGWLSIVVLKDAAKRLASQRLPDWRAPACRELSHG